MRLKDKVAIITGAGAGIGEAVAHKFAREGAKLVLNGLPQDPVQDVVEAIRADGGDAVAYFGDVSDEEHAQACVQMAIDEFDRLDILINNAGVLVELAETDQYDVEHFDYTVRMNVRSCFLMTKFALPYLQQTRGNIVSAGSEAGFNGTPRFTPYGGTKGFIHSFMKGVAVEQARYGVRANCVCPGTIATAWTYAGEGVFDKEAEKTAVLSTPLGRRGTPEEMANVYAFLASDEASFVTGALWLADGGITPAHGNVGEKVPSELAREPKGVLPLQHSRDGEIAKPLERKAG